MSSYEQAIHECMDIYTGLQRAIEMGLTHITLLNKEQYFIMCLPDRYFNDEPIENIDNHLAFKYVADTGGVYMVESRPKRDGTALFFIREYTDGRSHYSKMQQLSPSYRRKMGLE